MFRCEGCQENSLHCEKPRMTVVKTRVHHHPERKRFGDLIDDGGVGTQIVKEMKLCGSCALETKYSSRIAVEVFSKVEVFKPLSSKSYLYDINSAYPAVMNGGK